MCRGRGVEKSFLYDIVANVYDSLDVDKFDYLLRDSRHANIAIPFSQVILFPICFFGVDDYLMTPLVLICFCIIYWQRFQSLSD